MLVRTMVLEFGEAVENLATLEASELLPFLVDASHVLLKQGPGGKHLEADRARDLLQNGVARRVNCASMFVQQGSVPEAISTDFAAVRLFQRVNVPDVVLQTGRMAELLLTDRASVTLDSSVSVLVPVVR